MTFQFSMPPQVSLLQDHTSAVETPEDLSSGVSYCARRVLLAARHAESLILVDFSKKSQIGRSDVDLSSIAALRGDFSRNCGRDLYRRGLGENATSPVAQIQARNDTTVLQNKPKFRLCPCLLGARRVPAMLIPSSPL